MSYMTVEVPGGAGEAPGRVGHDDGALMQRLQNSARLHAEALVLADRVFAVGWVMDAVTAGGDDGFVDVGYWFGESFESEEAAVAELEEIWNGVTDGGINYKWSEGDQEVSAA